MEFNWKRPQISTNSRPYLPNGKSREYQSNLGNISLATLKRRLKEWGWKKSPPPDEVIREKIMLELNGLHSNVGYRYMKHLLLQKYRMFVPE
jgi:hypothetical protein